jgi:hypothetical protein
MIVTSVCSFAKLINKQNSLCLHDDPIFHFMCCKDDIDSHYSIEELERSINKYKMLAREVTPHTDEGKKVICRLVQLRLKLLEAKVC